MAAILNNVIWFVSTYWAALSIVSAFVVGSLFNPAFAHYLKNRENRLLEDIKSAIRASEDAVKDNIRRHEAEAAALRHLVTSQHSTRQSEIDKRRIQALEAVWAGSIALAPQKVVARTAEVLKLDVMLETASAGDSEGLKVQSLAEMLFQAYGIDKMRDVPHADAYRIFVSDNIWSKYVLYRQLLGRFIVQLTAVKLGAKPNYIVGPEVLLKALGEAMPHWADFLQKLGHNALPYLVEPLEAALLTEIQKELAGQAADEETIRRSRSVLDLISQYETAAKDADVKKTAGQ